MAVHAFMTIFKMLNMGYKATQSDPNNLSALISHHFLLLSLCSQQTDFLLVPQIWSAPTLELFVHVLLLLILEFYPQPLYQLNPFMPFTFHFKGDSWHQNTLDSILYTSVDCTFLLQMSSQLSFLMYVCYCLINVYLLNCEFTKNWDFWFYFTSVPPKPNTLLSN